MAKYTLTIETDNKDEISNYFNQNISNSSFEKEYNSSKDNLEDIKKELKSLEQTKIENNTKISNLEQDNKLLNTKIKKLNSNNQELEKQISNLKEKNKSLKNKINNLDQENINLKNSLDKYNDFNNLEKIYSNFDQDTKESLSNIFKSDDKLELFSAGILYFDDIVEQIKNLINSHNDTEAKKLIEFLDIISKYYLKLKNYSYQDVNIGDDFDIDKFDRDNRSLSQNGEIVEIIFRGFVKNDKIIYKSIVKVG